MNEKSSLTRWAEVSQILGVVLGIPLTILTLLVALGKTPKWLSTVMAADTVNAVITALLAGTLLAIAVSITLNEKRLRALERKEDAPPPSSGLEDPVILVNTNPRLTTVRLGEREFDLGPNAYEFYKRQSPEDREKLVRLMRRVTMFNKVRWTREDFVMEVDERQRIAITLARFIEDGDRLKSEINLEVIQRKIRASERSLGTTLGSSGLSVASAFDTLISLGAGTVYEDFTLNRMRKDVQEWRTKVDSFLRSALPAFASEFSVAVSYPGEKVSDLEVALNEIGVLIERLLDIKRRSEKQ